MRMGSDCKVFLSVFFIFTIVSCDWSHEPELYSEDVIVAKPATKICQLVGDYDREYHGFTINLTGQRYQVDAVDEGAVFRHKGRYYLLFGETWLKDENPIAYTNDVIPEEGLELIFLQDLNGSYRPIKIPGVSMGMFEVPTEGVSVDGKIYLYVTTDLIDATWPTDGVCGRSVVAVSYDDGYNFAYLYTLSRYPEGHFMQVSIVETELSEDDGFPESEGVGLVIFGGGKYRQESVALAFQPASQIENPSSIRYFAGLDENGDLIWSSNQTDAIELFDQPCIGEFSVTYNQFIEKWIMLYNCYFPNEPDRLRGINLRTADKPWGPWSLPKIVFEPWEDGGYCHFIHVDWHYEICDSVHDPGREYEWGGEYGPYQYEGLATGNESTTTIYFNMSTWNPYTVVLMKATLEKIKSKKDY